MARVSAGCTLRTTLANNAGFVIASGASRAIPSQAAVEAAVAVLEADAASPTQAHVTSLRAAWDAFVLATTGHDTAHMVVDYDNAALTTGNAIRAAMREIQQVIAPG